MNFLKNLKSASYTRIILFLVLSLFIFFTYVGPLGYALVVSFGGLMCVFHLRNVRHIYGIVIVLGLCLLWIIFRSSMLSDLQSGADFSQYQTWEDQEWLKMMFQSVLYTAFILAVFDLKDDEAFKLMKGLPIALVALSLWILADVLSNASIYRFISAHIYQIIRPDLAMVKLSIASYAFVLLYWPIVMLSKINHPRLGIIFFSAIVIIAIMTGANAPLIALLVSSLVFFSLKAVPVPLRKTVYLWLAFVTAAVILFTPVAVHALERLGVMAYFKTKLPASWDARIDIWTFSAQKIFEKPWIGYGFDTSRLMGPPIPLHPHNMALQIGMELGYIGLSLLAAFWIVLILRIAKTKDSFEAEADITEIGSYYAVDTRPYAMATASAFFTLAMVSFGIWQEWWLALSVICASILIMTQKAIRNDDKVSNPTI
jgi:O-antigen ligase